MTALPRRPYPVIIIIIIMFFIVVVVVHWRQTRPKLRDRASISTGRSCLRALLMLSAEVEYHASYGIVSTRKPRPTRRHRDQRLVTSRRSVSLRAVRETPRHGPRRKSWFWSGELNISHHRHHHHHRRRRRHLAAAAAAAAVVSCAVDARQSAIRRTTVRPTPSLCLPVRPPTLPCTQSFFITTDIQAG